jgi:CRP/FNR family transcriptional regulator, cyclic AMP receptor protein
MQHPLSEFRTVLEEQLTAWNLPAELAAEIEERSTPVAFEKGAIVFLRGAPADLVFWLRKGFVKVYLPQANGTRTLIAVARPGEPLGMVSKVDANGRSHQIFEAQALTKCSLGLVTRDHMMNVLRKLDSERVFQLLGNLNATWSALFERYLGYIALPFRERLEVVFKDLGARFGVDDKRGTLIILELSQEDLADMIGSSRPMVSKLVGDMIEEGLLTRSEQHQYILLSQAERQSKSAPSSEVTRSDGPISASKAPANMIVNSSNPARRDRSPVARLAMNHASGRHNV